MTTLTSIKTAEIKNALTEIYNDTSKHNKRISINGDVFIYISAKNEFRVEQIRNNYTVALLVGCMCCGRFMWCF